MTMLLLDAFLYVVLFYVVVIFVAMSDRRFYKAWMERRKGRGNGKNS